MPGRAARCRFRRRSEPALLVDHSNFVREENEYGRWRDPGGQSVAPEEVQGDCCPAGARSDQSAANIRHSDCRRKTGAVDVPKPQDLSQGSDDDEELNRDSDLSPTLSGHGESVAGNAKARDDLRAFCYLMLPCPRRIQRGAGSR